MTSLNSISRLESNVPTVVAAIILTESGVLPLRKLSSKAEDSNPWKCYQWTSVSLLTLEKLSVSASASAHDLLQWYPSTFEPFRLQCRHCKNHSIQESSWNKSLAQGILTSWAHKLWLFLFLSITVMQRPFKSWTWLVFGRGVYTPLTQWLELNLSAAFNWLD